MPSPKSILKSGSLVPYGDEDGNTSEDEDDDLEEAMEQQSQGNQETRPTSSSSPSPNLNNGMQTQQQQQNHHPKQSSNLAPKSNSSGPSIESLGAQVAKNSKLLLKLRAETHQLGRQISKRGIHI